MVLKFVEEIGTEEGQKGREKDAMTDEDNSGNPEDTVCIRFYLRSVLDSSIFCARFVHFLCSIRPFSVLDSSTFCARCHLRSALYLACRFGLRSVLDSIVIVCSDVARNLLESAWGCS